MLDLEITAKKVKLMVCPKSKLHTNSRQVLTMYTS